VCILILPGYFFASLVTVRCDFYIPGVFFSYIGLFEKGKTAILTKRTKNPFKKKKKKEEHCRSEKDMSSTCYTTFPFGSTSLIT